MIGPRPITVGFLHSLHAGAFCSLPSDMPRDRCPRRSCCMSPFRNSDNALRVPHPHWRLPSAVNFRVVPPCAPFSEGSKTPSCYGSTDTMICPPLLPRTYLHRSKSVLQTHRFFLCLALSETAFEFPVIILETSMASYFSKPCPTPHYA